MKTKDKIKQALEEKWQNDFSDTIEGERVLHEEDYEKHINFAILEGIKLGEEKARKEFLEWLIKLDKLIDKETSDILERDENSVIKKKIKGLSESSDNYNGYTINPTGEKTE